MLKECFITSETAENNREFAERLAKLFNIEIRDTTAEDEISIKHLQLGNSKAKILGPKEFITAFNNTQKSLNYEGIVGNVYLSGEESNGEINLFFIAKCYLKKELDLPAINGNTKKCGLTNILVVKTETNLKSLLKAFL